MASDRKFDPNMLRNSDGDLRISDIVLPSSFLKSGRRTERTIQGGDHWKQVMLCRVNAYAEPHIQDSKPDTKCKDKLRLLACHNAP